MYLLAIEIEDEGKVVETFVETQKAKDAYNEILNSVVLDLGDTKSIYGIKEYKVFNEMICPLTAILIKSNGIVTVSLNEINLSSNPVELFIRYRMFAKLNFNLEDTDIFEDTIPFAN